MTIRLSAGEGERAEEEKKAAWLKPLVETSFFMDCNIHGDSGKSTRCNMYCLDCMVGALCSYCVADHKRHDVVQIRRSSYHDVILVSEIEKLMDIRGVQTYITNSTKVVFLKGRFPPSSGKGVKNACHTCHKALLSTYSFCSLGCKLTGTKLNREIKAKQQRQKQPDRNAIESKKTPLFFQHDSADILDYNTSPLPPSTVNHTASARGRKAIPHKAPLGNEFP
eukprot:PITA_16800